MPDLFSILGGAAPADPNAMPPGTINNLPTSYAPDPMALQGPVADPSQNPALNPQALNILQQLAPQTPAADPTAGMMPQAAPVQAPAPVAAPAAAPAAAPRHRLSAIDVVGRIADTLAKVGGAAPLYQPTLDARQDRANALDDRNRGINIDNLKLQQLKSTMATAAVTADQTNAGKAVQAIQALVKNGGNAANAWGTYAKMAGVSPELTSHIQDLLAADPDGKNGALDAIDAQLNGIDTFKQPAVMEVDDQGHTKMVQYGEHGDTHVLEPDEGFHFAPSAGVQVDQGGTKAIIDPRTGQVLRTVSVTAHPDTVANNQTKITTTKMADASREHVAAIGAQSREAVAASRPGKAGAQTTGTAASTANAMTLLDNIQRGFATLHSQNALPDDKGGSVTGNIVNALQRSVPGANLVAEQAGGQAAQTRLLMEKDINSLQSEMVKSLPASATRTKFEQEIQRKRLPDPNRMSYATGMAAISDLRGLYAQAQRDLVVEQRASPAAAPARRILPAPAGVRPRAPIVNNW